MMAGQNIKTNYQTPAQTQKDAVIIKKHHERVALNREIREEARDQSIIGKAKRAVEGIKKNPTTKKVGEFVRNRAEGIAHETQDLRPRRGAPSPTSTFGMGMPGSPDMFGVGSFGGGGGLHGMMGADPFQEMFPRQAPPPPRPAPQRKKKRKRQTQHREPSGGAPPGMFGGIPKGMKWMF
jgi:hypothetical protein